MGHYQNMSISKVDCCRQEKEEIQPNKIHNCIAKILQIKKQTSREKQISKFSEKSKLPLQCRYMMSLLLPWKKKSFFPLILQINAFFQRIFIKISKSTSSMQTNNFLDDTSRKNAYLLLILGKYSFITYTLFTSEVEEMEIST